MISLTAELDAWIKLQGKKKPFTTASQYVRTVLEADYDNYKARFPKGAKPFKKSKHPSI